MTNYGLKNSLHASGRDSAPDGRSWRPAAVLPLSIALFYLLALISYSPADNAAISGGAADPAVNWLGACGAWTAMLSFYLIGLASWVLAAALLLGAIRGFFPKPASKGKSFAGILLLTCGATLLFALYPESFIVTTSRLGLGNNLHPESAISGGVLGQFFAAPGIPDMEIHPGFLREWLGVIGLSIASWIAAAAGCVLLYACQWRNILNFAAVSMALDSKLARLHEEEAAEARKVAAAEASGGVGTPSRSGSRFDFLNRIMQSVRKPETPEQAPVAFSAAPEPAPAKAAAAPTPPKPEAEETAPAPQPETKTAASPAEAGFVRMPGAPELPAPNGKNARPSLLKNAVGVYDMPKPYLLTEAPPGSGEDLQAIADARERLQNTLEEFSVNGTVTGHVSGPQVTRYEITLAPGVAVSKVSNISDNLLMRLQTQSIRILAPIPGRNVVGVEVPNSRRETVTLRSIFESPEWTASKAEIPVVLGKNVSGKPVVADLAKAPHLLIAGATGSGKSVCVNSLIMSLLYKFKPGELSLILIDPKVVEFTFYQTLPFLKTPVINESNKALLALRWSVNEMERRYRLLARVHTRNIAEYNHRALPAEPEIGEDGLPLPERLDLLVIVVDEFADLMMSDRNVRKDVESNIQRIAQKGRAAGIHIVLATQRPSTNVLTGTIKANLPTKIALRVGTRVDSQVILDAPGAQDLLGNGDMLFLPPNSPMLERIQGTWISNGEIEKVVAFISAQAKPNFDDRVTADPEEEEEAAPAAGGRSGAPSAPGGFDQADLDVDDLPEETDGIRRMVMKYLKPGDDSLVRQALEIVFTERQVSTSYLQRRLRIGYNRAADLVDEFERRGIVGPARDGGSKREILVFDEITGESQ